MTPAIKSSSLSYVAFGGMKDREVLKKLNQSKVIENIFNSVCDFYGVDKKEVITKSRMANLCLSRYIIGFLLRKHTRLTLVECGELLGHKHYTSVLHGVWALRGWMESDKKLVGEIAAIEEAVFSIP